MYVVELRCKNQSVFVNLDHMIWAGTIKPTPTPENPRPKQYLEIHFNPESNVGLMKLVYPTDIRMALDTLRIFAHYTRTGRKPDTLHKPQKLVETLTKLDHRNNPIREEFSHGEEAGR